MSSILRGNKITVSVFGQSHSDCIGAVIDGLPAGIELDADKIAAFMRRRAPGQSSFSTRRREADIPKVISGLVDGTTCGAPVAAKIDNVNAKSSDYDDYKYLPRPSHSDYTAYVKYGGNNDIAGGGQFSGRLTAPLCWAGAVCMQLLEEKGVKIKAHIYSVKDVRDDPFEGETLFDDDTELDPFFPVISRFKGDRMKTVIDIARQNSDSVGGVIECAVTGLPAGLGEPMFDGIENVIAKNMFAIPAVKGIEFGSGFDGTLKYGSQNNDDFTVKDGEVKTRTNNHGGILGGITSGMPVIFRVAIKPTPSIGLEQTSVNLQTMKEESITVKGRHDPCIVPRAVPAVEAVAAITVLDLLL
ncbi:MAG: chorismate synthase [Ruminococcaceae bacterium]|nr:chorismate synthase [Oscillospiraceae bacterium]